MATVACHYFVVDAQERLFNGLKISHLEDFSVHQWSQIIRLDSEGPVALVENLLKLDDRARATLLRQLGPLKSNLAAVSKQSMSQGSQLIVRRLE